MATRGLQQTLLLRGNVVRSDGTAAQRYLLIEGGVISEVSRQRPVCPPDVMEVTTGANDWIFPGLIDLHTHPMYNIMPLWHAKKAPFDNRYQWRSDKDYKAFTGIFRTVKKMPEFKRILPAFAELQAVAGGVTLLQESWDLDEKISCHDEALLCRGTAESKELGLPAKTEIRSVLEFFKPNASGSPNEQSSVERYVKARDKGGLHAVLAHLAEGKSGFGTKGHPADPYSRREFEAFMAHPAFADVDATRACNMSLIHCCAIDVKSKAHINFLRDRGMSVVWSPVSNLLLYDDTLNVEELMAQGIPVALGSDWSPSGSKHVWDEAKFARFYFEAIGLSVSDDQVYRMVTSNAAQCLGLSTVGRIEAGCLADFFILRSPLESDQPLEVFFKTTDRDVLSVLIGGRPIYGQKDFMEQFDLPTQPLPKIEGSAVRNKVVHLPEPVNVNLNDELNALEAKLKELGLPRSNLLAESDVLYRERISKLRERVIRYGRRVDRLRRKGTLYARKSGDKK